MIDLKNKKNVFIAITVLLIILVIIVTLNVTININSNKETTVIDNFDKYYYDVPTEKKDAIFSSLYSTIALNAESIPRNGAVIRNSTPYIYRYSSANRSYCGRFTVDIPSIEQSYLVEFNFPEESTVVTGGYSVLVYCVDDDNMVYPKFDCKENLPFYTNEKNGIGDINDGQ